MFAARNAIFCGVKAVRLPTAVTATITTGNSTFGLALSPDGSTLWATNRISTSGTISKISTATNTVTATISASVGDRPMHAVMAPNGAYLYYAGQLTAGLNRINTATNTSSSLAGSVQYVTGLAISPDGSTLWAAGGSAANAIYRINASTGSVTNTITVSGVSNIGDIAILPNNSAVYVGDQAGSTIKKISTSTNAVTNTTTVGSSPAGIAASPDGSTVWVSNYSSNTVSRVNVATNTVTSTISVGTGPWGVGVSADGNTVYIPNLGSGTVSRIDAATNTVTATIAIGGGTVVRQAVISPTGSPLYVSNQSTPGTVSVIT